DLIKSCFKPLAAGAVDASRDQGRMHIMVRKFHTMHVSRGLVIQDRDTLEARISCVELLTDTRTGSVLGCLPNLQQTDTGYQSGSLYALPWLSFLTDDGIDINTRGHFSDTSSSGPALDRCLDPPGK